MLSPLADGPELIVTVWGVAGHRGARGGHLCVACTNICDWDQNGIKRSTLFLRN